MILRLLLYAIYIFDFFIIRDYRTLGKPFLVSSPLNYGFIQEINLKKTCKDFSRGWGLNESRVELTRGDNFHNSLIMKSFIIVPEARIYN